MNDIIKMVTKFIAENKPYVNLALGGLIFLILMIFRNKISKGMLRGIGKLIFKKEENKEAFVTSLQKPLSTFFLILGVFALLYINVTVSPILKVFKIVTILIVCWGVMNYLSSNVSNAFLSKSNEEINLTALKFVSNIIRILVIAIAVVMIISELGYNINGLITGLGVGGLAVSLAAQDVIKNLISGFIIVFDKPFKVGDFIKSNDIEGTVLEVRMRSTKIRKLDDSVVTMPNTKLTDESVINISRMDKRLINDEIGITYSTPNDIIQKCLDDIKKYLISDDEIINDPLRVEFKSFEDSSLVINFFCYTTVTDIHEYQAVLSKVNMNIKHIIEENGAEFAFPSRSVYMEKK